MRSRAAKWKGAVRTRRRRFTSWMAALMSSAGGVVRLFGWLYVAVLVPALVISGYLVVRDAVAGAGVTRSLHLIPLAIIWPVAALGLRSESGLALAFPLNTLVLAGSVAFVLLGWAVLIRGLRNLFRWRAAR